MPSSMQSAVVLPLILVSNGFSPEYELGIANGLAAAGHRPLLVGSDKTLRERLSPEVQLLNLRGSQDRDRPRLTKALNMLRYWRSCLFLALRHRPGVVHVIGLFSLPSPLTNLVEALLLRLVSHHLVLTVHNLLPHDAESRFNHLVFSMIYRLPDSLVVHTPRMRDALIQRFGLPAAKVVVMEHGIDRVAAPGAQARADLLARLGLTPEQRIVLFFGALAPYKGLDLLIDAMQGLPADTKVVLLVAGFCRDLALKQQLQHRMAPLLAAGRAVWLDGYVPEDEVLPLFHGSDLLVMPYRHIDQSGVVFMALSTGLPVLATDVGSLAQYAIESGGGVVPVDDPAALAEAIQAMLPVVAKIDRQSGVDRARRYLWANTVPSLAQAYKVAA